MFKPGDIVKIIKVEHDFAQPDRLLGLLCAVLEPNIGLLSRWPGTGTTVVVHGESPQILDWAFSSDQLVKATLLEKIIAGLEE